MTVNRIPDGVGNITATAAGQVWHLAAGDTRSNFMASATFSPGTFSDVSLLVEGRLEAGNGKAPVWDGSGSHGFNMHVDTTGRVVSLETGSMAIFIQDSYFNLLNEGRIIAKGSTATAVALAGGSSFSTVINERVIKSEGGWGAVLSDDSSLTNHGRIISNSGFSAGVGVGGDNNSIFNDGLIRGNNGVYFLAVSGDSNTLFNEGRIVANAFAVFGSAAKETVINRGLLDGIVAMFSGNDLIDNRGGEITGPIDLGDGADSFLGGALREVVHFGAGADSGRMGGGNDRALGDLGNDLFSGGVGADVLKGQVGNDILKGGRGHDRLWGGDGDDFLVGGRDNDVLTGGAGADVFKFGVTAGSDRIRDYQDGADKIDLSALGISSFTQVHHHAHMSNGNTQIDLAALGGSGVLTLANTDIGVLDAGDFFL